MLIHRIAEVTGYRVSEEKAYSDYVKNSEFETINIFERENNSGTRLNEILQMTQPDQNIKMTQPDQNIQRTQPDQNIQMT